MLTTPKTVLPKISPKTLRSHFFEVLLSTRQSEENGFPSQIPRRLLRPPILSQNLHGCSAILASLARSNCQNQEPQQKKDFWSLSLFRLLGTAPEVFWKTAHDLLHDYKFQNNSCYYVTLSWQSSEGVVTGGETSIGQNCAVDPVNE